MRGARGGLPVRALAGALLLLASGARADGFQASRHRRSTLLSLTWDVGIPVEGLRDYVDERAYRGGQLELRRGIARQLSLGLAATWSWFSQNYTQKTIEYPGVTVTGPLYQRVRFASIRATGHGYLAGGPVQPYVGVSGGALSWATYRRIAGSVETDSGWAPLVDPAVGVLFTLRRGLALHVEGHLQYTWARFHGVEDARWVGIRAGLAGY